MVFVDRVGDVANGSFLYKLAGMYTNNMVRESSRDLVGLRIFVIYVSDTWLMNRDRHSLEVCLQGQGLSNI